MKSYRRRVSFAAALLALTLFAAANVPAQSFTLEQVMSSPFPSELTVSNRGDRVAWAFAAEGKRNIWMAESPGFVARQLTRYDKDDGGALSELVFAPNGNLLAYVRGEGRNQAGEYPNPTTDSAGTSQQVWIVDVRTGRTTFIGEGNTPTFAATGTHVVWIRNGEFLTAPAVGGKERTLFAMRGDVSGPQWSPDGTQLAFVSTRNDHSFISIYEPRTNQLRFIAPSVDRDTAPRWSPDGRRIAFIRLLNVPDTFSIDRDRIQPWAIWVADARTGQAKQIWRSGDSDNDSFPGLGSEDFWQWVAGDRLLFPSEKDGWIHLYSIPAGGGTVQSLTPGEFEVESATLSPDRTFLVVATNKNDIDRRHLWRVNLADGAVRQLTSGDGNEMYPALFDNGAQIAFFRSTARDPLMPFTARVDGSNIKPLAPQALPRDFPSAKLVAPEPVIFKAADGLEIHGQLFKPASRVGQDARDSFHARWPAPADAARLALSLLLPQRLRDESVSRQPRVHGSFGEFPQRHRLRSRISHGATSGRARRVRVSGHRGCGEIPARSRRRRQEAHRTVGRILRRLSDGAWPGERLRHLRRRR